MTTGELEEERLGDIKRKDVRQFGIMNWRNICIKNYWPYVKQVECYDLGAESQFTINFNIPGLYHGQL